MSAFHRDFQEKHPVGRRLWIGAHLDIPKARLFEGEIKRTPSRFCLVTLHRFVYWAYHYDGVAKK